MGSLLTSQRPAVWPAMLEGDIVIILDSILVSDFWFCCVETTAISAWWCGMIDLYRSCRRGSLCAEGPTRHIIPSSAKDMGGNRHSWCRHFRALGRRKDRVKLDKHTGRASDSNGHHDSSFPQMHMCMPTAEDNMVGQLVSMRHGLTHVLRPQLYA